MVQFCFPLYIRRANELSTQSHVTCNSLYFCILYLYEQAHYETIRKNTPPPNMQLCELGSVSLMNMNNHLLNKRKVVCGRTFAWVLPVPYFPMLRSKCHPASCSLHWRIVCNTMSMTSLELREEIPNFNLCLWPSIEIKMSDSRSFKQRAFC